LPTIGWQRFIAVMGKCSRPTKRFAQYKKYKEMKDRLQKVFHDMRVEAGQKNPDDTDLPE
jgi:hypothetical protein